MTHLFKVLNADGSCCNGGSGSWNLPQGNRPGRWMPKIDRVVPCRSGYHIVTLSQLPEWFGESIYLVEARGERLDEDNKVVVAQARLIRRLPWDERTARLFAADCAERVLPVYEREQPTDKRPRMAVEVARRFAEGQATRGELAAARAAARDAARDAARAAAWAARAAAWAARDAARDAARAAAWAAGGAAGDAAWDAARAARAAEREWQLQRLCHYLEIDYAEAMGIEEVANV